MQKEYTSSRLTNGNLWFPDRVTIASDAIHFLKRRIFGSDEEIINYDQIASVKINSGVLWADISIETAGGSQPVYINGLPKGDAQEIKDAIRLYQQG
ncbi:MAG: PH domain-containing protein [Anaerolineales bacterium]|nr:PH domain-containing protein [Anaerolineales bacterium]